MQQTQLKASRQRPPAWVWPALLALTIFTISSIELAPQPPFPGWFSPHVMAHFLVYGLMATLILRCFLPHFLKPLPILTAFLLTTLFGVIDEWRQAYNPVRFFSYQDMLINALGAAVAIAAYSFCPLYRNILERRVF